MKGIMKIRIKASSGKKIISYLASLSMFVNISSPFLIAMPMVAYAAEEPAIEEGLVQEVDQEEAAVVEEPADAEEVAEGSVDAEEQPVVEEEQPLVEETAPADNIVVPDEPVVVEEEPQGDILPEAVSDIREGEDGYEELAEGVEVIDTKTEDWTVNGEIAETSNDVALGVRYVFPLDEDVSVTFTKLPKNLDLRSHLKIERVKVSDLDLPDEFRTDAEYAFDITTEMKDGELEYDLTLPKPEGAEAEVSYIEKTINEIKENIKNEDIKNVDLGKLDQNNGTVEVNGLDHFTVFIVKNNKSLDLFQTNNEILPLVSALDFPYTCTGQCVSEDVKVQIIALVDASGNPLTCGIGDTSKDSYLKINYTSTASNRYSVYIQGQLLINGADAGLIDAFDTCVDNVSGSQEIIYHIGDVACGSSLSIRDLVLNWSNNTLKDETLNCENVFNVTYDCSSPKCYASTTDQVITTPPSLKLVKEFNPTGSGSFSDWTLAAIGPSTISGTPPVSDPSINYVSGVVLAGIYTLSETGPSGYAASQWSCAKNGALPVLGNSITLENNDKAVCTITNSSNPKLTLLKEVVDGTAPSTSWTLSATGTGISPTNISGATPVVSGLGFKPDTYTLSETGGFTDYSKSDWDCESNPDNPVPYNKDASGIETVSLTYGDDVTCTITNTLRMGTLTLVKTVTNDNGGTATESDFQAYIRTDAVDWDAPQTLLAGAYAVSESTALVGYAAGVWGGDCAADGSLTVEPGKSYTCSITNDDIAPKLTLEKRVDGVSPLLWTLTATGPTSISGATPVVSGSGFVAGTYTLSESGPAGFSPESWVCDKGQGASPNTVTLGIGDDIKCYVVNTRDTGNLKVQKIVDFGEVTDWWFSLDGGTAIQADSNGVVDFGQVTTIDNHTIVETGPLSTFHLSSISGTNCTPDILNNRAAATVTKGNTTVCLFSNAVNRGSITVVKDTVPNDEQDFGFTITGIPALGGFTIDDDGDSSNDLANSVTFSGLFLGAFTI
ncbi:MAG: hypothetical protein WC243_02150, partial [Patescibacteria group bacterium]